MNKYQWAEEAREQTADDRLVVLKKTVEQEERFTLNDKKHQLESWKKKVAELEKEIAEVEMALGVK